jgi:hypothetical protein
MNREEESSGNDFNTVRCTSMQGKRSHRKLAALGDAVPRARSQRGDGKEGAPSGVCVCRFPPAGRLLVFRRQAMESAPEDRAGAEEEIRSARVSSP